MLCQNAAFTKCSFLYSLLHLCIVVRSWRAKLVTVYHTGKSPAQHPTRLSFLCAQATILPSPLACRHRHRQAHLALIFYKLLPMRIFYTLLALLAFCLPSLVVAQSIRTVTFTGSSGDFNPIEKVTATGSSVDYYATYDGSNLYIGAFNTSGNFSSSDNFTIYLDSDPLTAPATGTGTTAGQSYNSVTGTLPFTANYNVHAEQGYQEARSFGSSWASTISGVTYLTGSNYREVKIPFTSIGSPVALYMTMWMGYNGGFFANAPGANIAASGNPTIVNYFGGIGLSSIDCAPLKTTNLAITGSVANNTVPTAGVVYGKLTFTGNATLANSFGIAPGGIYNQTAGTVSLSAAKTITFGGPSSQTGTGSTFNQSGGAFSVNATSAFVANGELAISNALAFNGTIQVGQKLTPSGSGTLTMASGSTLDIRAGGYLNALAPTYASGSTLAYNTGNTFNASAEWTAGATSGAGVPSNVTVGAAVTSTLFSFGTSTLAYTASKNLTVASGSGFALSSNSGGDLNLAGDFTNSGTFYHNSRAVFLNGGALQTLAGTLNGSGTTNYFPYLFITNSVAAGVTSAVNVNAGTSGGSSFTVGTGTKYDQTGGTLTMASGATSTVTGTLSIGASGTLVNGSTMSVPGTLTVTGTGSTSAVITVSGTATVAGTLALSSGLTTSGGATTVGAAGTLDIRSGGYVSGTAPTYTAGATLAYNSGGSYTIGGEWTNATAAAGFPSNVSVGAAVSGTTLTMGSGTTAFSLGKNLTISASSGLTLSTGVGGDLKVAGNFTNNGTFTHSNRAVYLNGVTQALAGTFNGSGATNFFPYLFITATNAVTAANSVNVGTNGISSFTSTVSGTSYTQTAGTLTVVTGAIGSLTGPLGIPSGAFLVNNGILTTGTFTLAGTATNNATLTIAGAASSTVSGTLTSPIGSTLSFTANTTNVASGGVLTLGGTVTGAIGVTFQSGSTGSTLSGTWTQSGGTVNAATAGSLFTISGTFTSTGGVLSGTAATLVFTQTGTYTHNTVPGSLPIATWTAGSPGALCNIIGITTNNQPANLNQTGFNHFTWNCAQTVPVGLGGNLTNVGGNLTFSNTGGPTTNYLSLNTGTASSSLTVGGNLIINGSGVYLLNHSGTSGTVTLNVAGNIVQTAGLWEFNKTGSSSNFNLQGNFDQQGGTITRPGTTTPVFNFIKASGIQTYNQSGTITGTITYNVGNGTTTTNTLQLVTNIAQGAGAGAITVLNGSTIDFQTFLLTGAGSFITNSGSSLISANANATGTFTSSGTNGSVQVSGTRIYNAATNYTFNGASAQVEGNGPTGATTLTVSNASGLTLSANLPITGNVSTTGNVTLGTFDLTVGGTLTVSAGKYIKTNSTGQLKQTVGGAAVLFPVGNSAYNPITFTNSGTSDVYGIRVVDAAPPAAAIPAKAVNRYWVVTEGVAGGSNLAVTAQYNTGEEGASFAAGTTPYIGLYNSTSWSQGVATAAGSNPYTFTSTSNFTPGDLASAATRYFAIAKDDGLANIVATYTWVGGTSNDWDVPGNWDLNNGFYPGSADNVVVNTAGSPFPLYLHGNRTVTDFTLSGTGTFNANAGETLTITGTSAFSSSASIVLDPASTVAYTAAGSQIIMPIGYGNLNSGSGPRVLSPTGTISIAGTFTPGAGAYTPAGSTVNFNGSGSQTVPAVAYNNLTISGTRLSTPVITLASGIIGIAGNLSYTASGVGSVTNTSNTIDYNGTGAQTVGAFPYYNSLTISGSHGTNSVTLQSGTISVKGVFSPTATFSTGGYVVTGNTIDFTSAGAQTIPVFNYYNLSNTGNGARTLANGVIGVGGSYSPTSGAITIGTSTLDFTSAASQTIPATFYYNITNSGNGNRVFANSGTIDVGQNFTPGTGSYTITGSSFKFSYAGVATINFAIPVLTTNIAGRSYNNLELVGGSSTTFSQAAGSSIGVAGTFAMSGSGQPIYSIGSTGASSLIVDGDAIFTNSPKIRVAGGAGTGLFSIGGNFTSTATGVNILLISLNGGAGTMTVAGNFSMNAATAGSSCVTNSTGNGSITVGGTFTLAGLMTFSMINTNNNGSAATITATGKVTITGTASLKFEPTSTTSTALFIAQGDCDFTSTVGTGIVSFGTGNTAGNEFRIGGNMLKSGAGFFSTTATTSDPVGFTFNKAGTQTFSYSGANSVGTAYTIATGSTLQMLTGLTLGTGTTPRSNFTVNGTLDMGTQTITAANATDPIFTLASGATLKTANVSGIAAGFSGFTAGTTLLLNATANYELNGAAAATGTFTTTSTAQTVNNLTINSSANVTLSTALTVNGTLQFSSGNLTLGSNSLTLGSGAFVSGPSSTKYAQVTGTGGFIWTAIPQATTKLFPIGTATSYTPITITNQQVTAADFTAKVTSTITGTVFDATRIVNLNWAISSTSTNADVAFQWNSANQAASFNPANPIEVGRYSSPGYTIVASALTASGSNPYSILATGLTSFSSANPYILGNTASVGPTTYTWTGTTSSNWATATNWNPNGVPTATDYVILNVPGANTLSINSARTVTNFTLSGTGSIAITPTGSLTIGGTVTYSGTPTATLDAASTVNYAGSSSQDVAPLNYGNLNLTGGARVFPSPGTVGVAGTLTPGAGALTFTGSTVNFNGTVSQTVPVLSYYNLSINNAAGGSLAGNTTVSNNFSLGSGALLPFAATSTILAVNGGLANNGTVTGSGTAKILLNGGSAQTMTGSGTYYNLELNNAAGVASSGNPTVSNSLSLIAGKINTSTDTITLGSAATLTETIGGTENFVRGFIKTTRVVGTAASTFGGLGYELTAGSNIGTVKVVRQSGAPVTGQGVCCSSHHSILRTYKVTPSQQPAVADRNVYVKWPSQDDNGQNLVLFQLWKSPDGIAPYSRIGSVQNVSASNPRAAFIYHIPSFSVFTGADNVNPLPLGLTSFTASYASHAAQLAWKVSQEGSWSKFAVERSIDGKVYQTIGYVTPKANSRSLTSYAFADKSLIADSYYRLRLIGLAGEEDYSEANLLKLPGSGTRVLSIFPNPASQGARISLDGSQESSEWVQAGIYRIDGSLVDALEGNLSDLNSALESKVQALPAGIYQIRVTAQEQVSGLRLIKQ